MGVGATKGQRAAPNPEAAERVTRDAGGIVCSLRLARARSSYSPALCSTILSPPRPPSCRLLLKRKYEDRFFRRQRESESLALVWARPLLYTPESVRASEPGGCACLQLPDPGPRTGRARLAPIGGQAPASDPATHRGRHIVMSLLGIPAHRPLLRSMARAGQRDQDGQNEALCCSHSAADTVHSGTDLAG